MDIEKYNDLISQGIGLMATENYEAAEKKFSAAIKENPKEKETYRHLGNAYANLQRYEEAIATFKKILYLDAKDAETFYAIGSIYILLEDKEKAIENYNKAESLGYDNAEMYEIMASVFLEEDDPAQALRNINRAIALSPLEGNLRIFKVRVYLAYDKFNEALATLDDMEKILPDAFEVYDLKSQIYLGQGNYQKAIETVNKGCARFPKDAGLALIKLRILVESSKTDLAYELINEMKKNGMYEEQLKDTSVIEATLLIQDNKIDDAQNVLKNAHESLPQDEDILYLIVDLNGKIGKYEEVLKYSQELIEHEPQQFYLATAMYFYAVALEETGNKEEALKIFKNITVKLRKMTIDTPAFYEGYLYRLLSHTKLGEYDKALELAEYVENLYPEKSDAHAFKYFIYKEMGDMDSATNEKVLAQSVNPELILD